MSKKRTLDADFIKAFKSKNYKVRPGFKEQIDLKTFKSRPLYTIEIWIKEKRRYYPMRIPTGEWFWLSFRVRDSILKQLTK